MRGGEKRGRRTDSVAAHKGVAHKWAGEASFGVLGPFLASREHLEGLLRGEVGPAVAAAHEHGAGGRSRGSEDALELSGDLRIAPVGREDELGQVLAVPREEVAVLPEHSALLLGEGRGGQQVLRGVQGREQGDGRHVVLARDAGGTAQVANIEEDEDLDNVLDVASIVEAREALGAETLTIIYKEMRRGRRETTREKRWTRGGGKERRFYR